MESIEDERARRSESFRELVTEIERAGYKPKAYNETPMRSSMYIDFDRKMKLGHSMFDTAMDLGYAVSCVMVMGDSVRVWFREVSASVSMEM